MYAYLFTRMAEMAGKASAGVLFACILLLSAPPAEAQVMVPFKKRLAGDASPADSIFHIKGDFTMVGNSNLTFTDAALRNRNSTNNEQTMEYIDVDTDGETLNSSSADLQYPAGVDPACTRVVYAGLYWTGRANETLEPNPATFGYMQKAVNNGGITTNGAAATGYTMRISSSNQGGYYPRYTFSGNGLPTVIFDYMNNQTIRCSANGGISWTNLPARSETPMVNGKGQQGTWIPLSDRWVATLNTPYVFAGNNGSEIRIHQLIRNPGTTIWSAIGHSSSCSAVVEVRSPDTHTLDKRVVRIMHENAGAYTAVSASDIYYPDMGTAAGQYTMYAGYYDVTDYVRNYGAGNYTVADVALTEGQSWPGYFGGWGMVVVYENEAMPWRDVAVFDGYANTDSNNPNNNNFDLVINGFHAVQGTSPVGVNIGFMVAEGESNSAGDYFWIARQENGMPGNTLNPVNAPGRTANDFFVSRIEVPSRNPAYQNNAGFDIALFDLPNGNKQYITNDQTRTRFRYGTTSDSYMIFCMVLGLDAYIPEPELENATLGVHDKDGNPVAPDASGNYTVEPGARIDYEFRVRNRGLEAINNLLIDFPFPQTATLEENTLADTYYAGTDAAGYSLDYSVMDARIVWKVPHIPVPATEADRETVYASLKFTLKVTEDCNLLSSTNPACSPGVVIEGSIGGTGDNTGISSSHRFIYGFTTDACGNQTPVTDPPVITVDAGNHNCPDPGEGNEAVREIEICTNDASVPYADIRRYYPGARFYTAVDPVTGKGAGAEHTGSFVFGTEYYAVPTSLLSVCYYAFRTVQRNRPVFDLAAENICQGEPYELNGLVQNPQPSGITVRFFDTEADALNGRSPIPNPLTAETEGPRILYARSFGTGGCNSEVVSIDVVIEPSIDTGPIYRVPGAG